MPEAYDSDDKRWNAVKSRDAAADGCFLYGVITTGIYCYPSCPSRTARRTNTRFYVTRHAAQQDGLRSCKRCHSDQPPLLERQSALVQQACRLIDESAEPVRVESLAIRLGISRFNLQRIFQQFLGMGPKQYMKAIRARHLAHELTQKASVTEALFDAGYDSSSAYYADGAQRIGMPAHTYRRHGEGQHIRYAFASTRYGGIVVAATERGVCSVLFGESHAALEADLHSRFRRAVLVQDRQHMQQLVDEVVAGIENPALASRLPLDIQGTAFQEKVWSALRRLAPGETVTYSDVAARIGRPSASRAVAGACAANPLAVIVPCHRVVRSDATLSGYRWGIDKKRRLLEDESETD